MGSSELAHAYFSEGGFHGEPELRYGGKNPGGDLCSVRSTFVIKKGSGKRWRGGSKTRRRQPLKEGVLPGGGTDHGKGMKYRAGKIGGDLRRFSNHGGPITKRTDETEEVWQTAGEEEKETRGMRKRQNAAFRGEYSHTERAAANRREKRS